jgi:peptidoglycan/xylan/chitin deacetylase (PgdA/CDA1 family)
MGKYFFAWGLVAAVFLMQLAHAPQDARIVRRVDCTEKFVALTIDDGPYPKSTEKLLKVLDDNNVKATFFVLGENAVLYPDLFAKIKEKGHEIASHSFTHRHLNKLKETDCREEFSKAEEVLGKVDYFRPPGGLYNEQVLKEAQARGYKTILWSIDTLDWQKPSCQQVVNKVMANIKEGSIILLHDGQANLPTPQAINIFVDSLKKQGYTFKTIGELLNTEKND